MINRQNNTIALRIANAFVMLGMVMLGMSACSERARLKDLVAEGEISKENVYRNDKIGLSLTIPASWKVFSEDTTTSRAKRNVEPFGESYSGPQRTAQLLGIETHDGRINILIDLSYQTRASGYDGDDFERATVEAFDSLLAAHDVESTSFLDTVDLDGKRVVRGTVNVLMDNKLYGITTIYIIRHQNYLITLTNSCKKLYWCSEIDKVMTSIELEDV